MYTFIQKQQATFELATITIECRKTNFYLNFENLSAATEELFRKNARNYRFKTCLTPIMMYFVWCQWCTLPLHWCHVWSTLHINTLWQTGCKIQTPFCKVGHPGAPRAKLGPGVSSNIRHLWFCALQNGRGECHNFLRILM